MFDAKPGCWMYKQGNFIAGFFPEDVVADIDEKVGVFGFPPAEAGGENPVLGGGDMAMMLDDTDVDQGGHEDPRRDRHRQRGSARAARFISPHKDFDMANYPNDVTR